MREAGVRPGESPAYVHAMRELARQREAEARALLGAPSRGGPGGLCPCGCKGRVADHDDRGWGCWNCPACGEESDRDLDQPCSDCQGEVR